MQDLQKSSQPQKSLQKPIPVDFQTTRFLEGDWKFIGYFPNNCKDVPPCSTDKVTFKKLDHQQSKDWMLFKTSASLRGDECSFDDTKHQHYGFTWANNDRIQYGGGNTSEVPPMFSMMSDEYKMGITPSHYQHLFIRNGEESCYLQFEKERRFMGPLPPLKQDLAKMRGEENEA